MVLNDDSHRNTDLKNLASRLHHSFPQYHQRACIRVVGMLTFLVLTLLFTSSPAYTQSETTALTCGAAVGFPPYQFNLEDGTPAGIDIDIVEAMSRLMDTPLILHQEKWDDVMAKLRLGKLDCVAGMEITTKRRIYYDFTVPYYNRESVVFIRADNNSIHSIQDLRWKVIAGDRHSNMESHLKEMHIRRQIRIRQTASKETSLQLLKQKEVVAAIAPKQVGYYLARKLDLDVRILDHSSTGTPVAFAVRKGNQKLLDRLNTLIKQLKDNGEVDEVMAKWSSPRP